MTRRPDHEKGSDADLRQVDFNGKTLLERAARTAREPVYSAALAWMLAEGSPLPLARRLEIVKALSGEDLSDGQEIMAETEWHRVDLLLKVKRSTDWLHVAVENKIKAVEGREQLAAYDSQLAQLNGTVRKVFLTLNGEKPRSGAGWLPVSYAVILEVLRAHPASSSPYITDLCIAIERLLAVAEAAREESGVVATAAFAKSGLAEADDIVSYVREMRLEKLVQRIWMTDLGDQLQVRLPWRTAIDETHGQALLNVQALLQDPPRYLVGMQLQSRTLKAFCAPHPYPKRASAEQHRTVESILETIRSGLMLGAQARPSAGAKRGFRSFSIPTDFPRGRKHDEWAAALSPQIARLVAAFPSVRPVASDVVPLPEDD